MRKKTVAQIARAIVHLNFNEPEKARDVLIDALSDINFGALSDTSFEGKENSNGNAAAATV